FQVDVDAEDANGLQAVEPVLRRGCQARSLDLKLVHLAYADGNDQEYEAREGDDDREEDDCDGDDAGYSGPMEPNDRGLNEESDGRPEHEGSQKVAEQEENGDEHQECGDRKADLQVATAPLGVESPGRGRDPARRGRSLQFSLVGRFPVRTRTHVTHSGASMTSQSGTRARFRSSPAAGQLPRTRPRQVD